MYYTDLQVAHGYSKAVPTFFVYWALRKVGLPIDVVSELIMVWDLRYIKLVWPFRTTEERIQYSDQPKFMTLTQRVKADKKRFVASWNADD